MREQQQQRHELHVKRAVAHSRHASAIVIIHAPSGDVSEIAQRAIALLLWKFHARAPRRHKNKRAAHFFPVMPQPPSEIVMDGNVLPLHTYEQLDMDKKKTKTIATNLRDRIGADLVPPIPLSGPIDHMIAWILHTQCFVCKYAGFDGLTLRDFGAPLGFGQGPGGYVPGNQQGYTTYQGLETPFGLDSDVPDQRRPPPRPAHQMRMPGM